MTDNFQSRTFMFGFPEGESFKIDIQFLNNLGVSKLEKLAKFAAKIVLADNDGEKRELYNKIINENLINSLREIESFYRFSNFFLKKFSSEETENDSPEIIIKDLSKKLDIKKEGLSPINTLLVLIKKEIDGYKKEKLKKSLKRGVFPYIKGFNTTVELRGIFSKEFDLGDDFELYTKEVKLEENTIPIISVAISLDSGIPDEFYFQASREHLKLLVDELKSALHKSKLLEEKFNAKGR